MPRLNSSRTRSCSTSRHVDACTSNAGLCNDGGVGVMMNGVCNDDDDDDVGVEDVSNRERIEIGKKKKHGW